MEATKTTNPGTCINNNIEYTTTVAPIIIATHTTDMDDDSLTTTYNALRT